ncbi:MAG: hypothetical protein PVH88_26295 [Ignavibacteria bacterium]|jgi:hypothetical protein
MSSINDNVGIEFIPQGNKIIAGTDVAKIEKIIRDHLFSHSKEAYSKAKVKAVFSNQSVVSVIVYLSYKYTYTFETVKIELDNFTVRSITRNYVE